MPGSFVIHPQHRLVYARLEGQTTREDIVSLRQAVADHPQFDRRFDAILDFSQADLSSLSSSDVEALAAGSSFDPAVRRVLVADREDKFGLSRMFQIRRGMIWDDDRTHAVHSVSEAMQVLGLPDIDPARPSPER